MNLKLHGRNIEKFYCKKCFMKEYGWDFEAWNYQIDMFRQAGCELF